MSSIQNLQSIEPKKTAVALDGAPARVGMMIEHFKLDLLHRASVGWRGPRVIDHPVMRAVVRNARGAQKYHYMVGKFLDPGLIEDKQIAWLSGATITANEKGIEMRPGATIDELRQFSLAASRRCVR